MGEEWNRYLRNIPSAWRNLALMSSRVMKISLELTAA